MKKRTIVIFAIGLVILIVISFMGGQAYAKYMSKVTGKGNAAIASWKFKANDNESSMQNITLRSTLNNEKISNYQLAPGTKGSFQIKLDASGSEVGINYVIKFENETIKPTNLRYIYEGNIYNSLNSLQSALVGTFNANDEDKIKTLTINWEWPFETGITSDAIIANDKIDTQNSMSLADYSFDIVISGTQVKPEFWDEIKIWKCEFFKGGFDEETIYRLFKLANNK